jgi:hypothetical protein
MATREEREVLANRLDELGAGGAAGTARGANRLLNTQISDLGVTNVTPRGKSGGSKNLITNRAVQTGGAGDGVKRNRSTTHFEQPTDGSPGTLKRFRESAAKIGADDPSLSNVQALSKSRRRTTTPSDTSLSPTGGTTRLVKPKAESLGRFTDQGEFTQDGVKLRGRQKKSVSPFSEQGIGQLFGSAADLAKLFSSKEFQQRKAQGVQAAAGIKGRRADTKAKTERIKALSGVLEDLSASGGDNEGLMARIQEQIQGLISGDGGGGASSEVVAKLADQFDDDQIKTILGIIR